MKSWFVYVIDNEKIGTWANNSDEAERNLRKEYGDVPMEYVGVNYAGIGPRPDKVIRRGMSPIDTMLAYGLGNMLASLRY